MAAAVTAMAVACSQDQGPAADAVGATAMAAQDEASLLAEAVNARRAASIAGSAGSGPMASVASLPDRGDLVAYPQEPVVRREGPYKWTRADISEAHALNAIVDGVLSLTTPSGEQLRFQYDRHVEHDSGDWTWIGHIVGGGQAQDAILTFGVGAVFGSIDQPGKAPLKLAMADGAAWMVETDRAALAAQSAASGRYDRPDFLVPPELPAPEGQDAAADSVRMASALPGGKTTIDVLVGYTTGFATAQMGRAGIRANIFTRLNHLVDITNESYRNSEVNAEVRLVHTMEVDYTDANDNSTALQSLTGSDGSDPVARDPALEALYAARETYGADLVTLVRDFQHPEAVSCGVAWLVGGGQNTIHAAYEAYGMSVVSDGDDSSYGCAWVTFAHELGHNMGLAHDVETSKGDDGVLDNPDDYGRYAYSFGYRTGPANGNFYTVMAYPDTGDETSYHVFSNPDVTICGGLPCGIEGQADNAETLRQTIPIIATFRDTVVPLEPDPTAGWVQGDFNADGSADLLWRNGSTGQNVLWRSGSATTPQAVGAVAGTAWAIAGIGDFDGDGLGDIFWRNATTGQNTIWRSGQRNAPMAVTSLQGPHWFLAGIGDFDGDGMSDVLWRNGSTGQNVIWGSASAGSSRALALVGGAWQVAGIGDFDGDGADDIFWRNGNQGQNVIWRSADAGAAMVARAVGLDWTLVAVADFDGDGASDLLWRQLASGRNVGWLGADANTPLAVRAVATDWEVVAAGDYDGDGNAGLVWRHATTGANRLWKSANAATSVVMQGVADLAWQPAP